MFGVPNEWIDNTVKLGDHEFVTVANPKENTQVSLIFFRLPDGNISGQGFKAFHNQSLARLQAGKIGAIQSVDEQSYYSSDQLTAALTKLIQTYQPTEIDTQATRNFGQVFSDHSDHLTAGKYAQQAYMQYLNHANVSIHYYIGYPTRERSQNVSGDDLKKKSEAFHAYNKFDKKSCQTIESCNLTPDYGAYLKRQYAAPNQQN